jgi:uncharacterized protein YjbI with pentapeptide repeats
MKAEDVLSKYAAGERNFPNTNLTEANLSGANLSGANLSGANLSVANLSGANLSAANLSKAKLNVAKLSGANLGKSNLCGAILNVANLTLADLKGAELSHASLVRAELNRAELSGANLNHTNFSGADLKDAKLRNANLTHANLSRADLKWTTVTSANLSQANLHGTDLSSADFSGADLSNTELRQANLSRTNLRGANLTGANLRWADLSGADLSGADLSGARLSGANLTGANLSNATLLGTTLVHVDLTRANLIGVDWAGADLSGATLTGAKIYAAPRYGIKTEGLICDWIDLSPNGDQSKIYRLGAEAYRNFFRETSPAVRIVVDAMLDHDAHHALALTYRQIAQHYQFPSSPPNIQVGRRRTTLTFEGETDQELFLLSYVVILPFKDAANTQEVAIALTKMVQSAELANSLKEPEKLQLLNTHLNQLLAKADELTLSEHSVNVLRKIKFFQSPTKTTLINSSNRAILLYSHPTFGKRAIHQPDLIPQTVVKPQSSPELPPLSALVEFIQGFH